LRSGPRLPDFSLSGRFLPSGIGMPFRIRKRTRRDAPRRTSESRRRPARREDPDSAPVATSAPRARPSSAPHFAHGDAGRADRHGARLVCVTSGKGGTGKSTIAVNLAVRLARDGARVTLVDADLGMANAHLLLGVTTKRNLLDLVRTDAEVDEVAVSTPFGPRLLSGGSGIRELAALGPHPLFRLIRKLEHLRLRDEWVVIDTGAGIGPTTLMFLWATRDVVLVTNPEITALTDGYAIVKTLLERAVGHRIGIVVNRARTAEQARQAFGKLDGVTRRFVGATLADYGTVFEHREVAAAGARRRPFILDDPHGPFASGIDRIAAALRAAAAPGPSLPRALREVSPGLGLEARRTRRRERHDRATRSRTDRNETRIWGLGR